MVRKALTNYGALASQPVAEELEIIGINIPYQYTKGDNPIT